MNTQPITAPAAPQTRPLITGHAEPVESLALVHLIDRGVNLQYAQAIAVIDFYPKEKS